MCDTYNCDYLHSAAQRISFQLNRFSVKYRFPFPILRVFFTVKSPSVTQRSVSQENAFKKSKTRRLFFFFFKFIYLFFFFRNSMGSTNSFTLIENNFRFLRYRIQGNSIAYGQNAPICNPLRCVRVNKCRNAINKW